MHNIYDKQERWRLVFYAIALCIAIISIYISNQFVKILAEEEEEKMEIWAEATKQLSKASEMADQTLVLTVLKSNNTIPVIVVDQANNILWNTNIRIPKKKNKEDFLRQKLEEYKEENNVIEIEVSENVYQYLYYGESYILKALAYYPYILLLIIMLFMLSVYWVLNSIKRAEQDQVWVGLTKETAHQLGTPISSLIAWIEVLRSVEKVDESLLIEMNKDIDRLQTIADRFSKIGSQPKLETVNISWEVETALTYMRKRISQKVMLFTDYQANAEIALSIPLFAWVIENLCKNAIDAMKGEGEIHISTFNTEKGAIIDIRDTGKGVHKSKFKTIFNPGYTTKKRGWGLGLTLVKRIIEEYHNGKIYIKDSERNKGTTFRIELRNTKLEEKK